MGRLFDGTCRLCGEAYKGQGMTSHVKGCLTEHANLGAVHHGLLVGMRADGVAGRFWMYVQVRPEAQLAALDAHLREAWFDDDHASVFEIEGTRYVSTLDEAIEGGDGEDEELLEPMSVPLGQVIRPRMEFRYLYDPAQPTQVELTVYDPYPMPEKLVEDDREAEIATVARNDLEAPECSTCDAPATHLCPACAQADETELGPFVCEECRERHEGPLQPLRNSPRAGTPG